jgi:glyoxylase-like metal-dependent hydrolase (beta-lactamase superfamily II)
MEHRCETIDCDYLGPQFAAAYLRIAGEEAAFIEANTAHALPKLLAALDRASMRPEQVRWIIVTHAHLDHAAGAGALMNACPNATLLAHPRAGKHLIDPSRLVASATKVYGEARFSALYGAVKPIAADRVRALDDGAHVDFGDARLHFFHTRGHANHHFVVHDPALDTVFTGDAFGLTYPVLQRARRFSFPSTSPTDFDAAEAIASIDRVVALGTRTARLTHFGAIDDVAEVASQLRWWLERSAALLDREAASDRDLAAMTISIERDLREAFADRASASGLALTTADWSTVALDLDLNAQGIAWVAQKKRENTPPRDPARATAS